MRTRREIYEAHFRRYQEAGKSGKGKILDELAGTTGLNRDHLAHVLASCGKKRKGEDEGNGGVPKARRSRKEGRQENGAGDRQCIRNRRSSGC